MFFYFFKHNDFIKNTSILVLGTIVSQVIPVLIMPILTRVYSPEDFGQYALFMSVIGILSVVATARYEVAIILPRSSRSSLNILIFSMIFSFFFSLLTLVVVSFCWVFLDASFDGFLLFFVPLAVFSISISQSLRLWLNKNKDYKKMALSNVEQSVCTGASQLAIALVQRAGSGLVYGQVLSQILISISLLKYCWKDLYGYDLSKNKLRIYALAKRYFYLVKYGVPALLTSRVAQESLFFLVAIFFSDKILGFVMIVQRLVGLPASVISTNLGSVFYERVARCRKDESFSLVKKYIFFLIFMSFPVFLVYYALFIKFFVFIFGEQWLGAVDYAVYFFIVAAFSFVFSPLTVLFNYYELQGWNFIWQSLWLISNVCIFYVCSLFDGGERAAFHAYSISQSFLYAAGIFYFYYYARKLNG